MILEVARAKMYEAMKNKDKEQKDFYAFLLDKLMKAAKAKQNPANPNPTLSEAEELAVVQTIVKQIRSSVTEVQKKLEKMTNEKSIAEAKEFIAAREVELARYEAFLPKQMTEDEIKATILVAYNEIPDGTVANKGMLMKYLMPKVKDKADGKRVAELADEFLKSL
jgi:uncharacterized protein YqeY